MVAKAKTAAKKKAPAAKKAPANTTPNDANSALHKPLPPPKISVEDNLRTAYERFSFLAVHINVAIDNRRLSPQRLEEMIKDGEEGMKRLKELKEHLSR